MRTLPLLLALAACAPAMNEDSEIGANAGRAVGSVEPTARDSAPVVLTWPAPASGAYHPMGLEGTLEVDGRCIYVRTPAYRFLLVFPEGTSWDEAAGAIRFGTQQLRPGSRIALGGDSLSGAAAVAPGFDARGCDAGRVFRVAPWLAR